MIIRRKKLKDLIALTKITKDSFPSPIRHIPYLLFFALVAEENSKVAGFVVLLNQSKKTGEIALMAISENYRGQNIGSKLINEAFVYLKSKGKKYCKSKIRVDNPRALKFYEKNGFRVKKILKRPVLGDVYSVEKKLV